MKVLYQDDNRFLIDCEDGKKEVLIVKYDGTPESLTVFNRTSSLHSALRFGMWEDPDPEASKYILSQLRGKKFPVQSSDRYLLT